MALKDTWKDFQDVIEGVPDSGDKASVEPINEIAHAVIDLENDKENGETVDLSNYYTKDEIITEAAPFIISHYSLVATGDLQYYYTKDEVEEIAGTKENISNKCKHIDDPNQIDYPTTQAVWDLVQEEVARLGGMIEDVEVGLSGQIGDINTALEAIIAIQHSILGVSE